MGSNGSYLPLAPLTERELSPQAETGDLVCFLLGCSFSWEDQLTRAGLLPRHIEQQRNVPMYRTNIKNAPFGPFVRLMPLPR